MSGLPQYYFTTGGVTYYYETMYGNYTVANITAATGDLTNLTFPEEHVLTSNDTFLQNWNFVGSTISIQGIGNEAFKYNTNIQSVTISSRIQHIGTQAFKNCGNLSTVTFSAGGSCYTIGDLAFAYAPISSIVIPASVATINNGAFQNCTSLASVTFAPNSGCTSIGWSSFSNTGIQKISIPSGVTAIGNYAFQSSDLTLVIFERTVWGQINIGADAFDATTLANKTIYISPVIANNLLAGGQTTSFTSPSTGTISFFGQTVYLAPTFKPTLTSQLQTAVDNWCQGTPITPHISLWDTSLITNMDGLFHNKTTFNDNIGSWDTSNVMSMHVMFNTASSFNQNIGSWDVSKVTGMNSMFAGATAFNNNGNTTIRDWDVSKVTGMNGMFQSASSFNIDIETWDTRKVTDMAYMFNSATLFNRYIRTWNVSNVTYNTNMFFDAIAMHSTYTGTQGFGNTPTSDFFIFRPSNKNALVAAVNGWINPIIWSYVPGYSAWSIGSNNQVVSTNHNNSSESRIQITYNTTSSFTLSFDFSISSETNFDFFRLYSSYDGAALVNEASYSGIVGGGTFSRPFPAGNYVFQFAYYKDGSVSVDPDNVIVSNINIADTYAYNGKDISVWDTSLITDMSSLFENQTNFNDDISNWDTSNVTNMSYMFRNATTFNKPIQYKWNVMSVTSMYQMFVNATAFANTYGTSTGYNNGYPTSDFFIFRPLSKQELIDAVNAWCASPQVPVIYNGKDISVWDTSQITDMSSLFLNQTTFNDDISNWATSQVTNFDQMFKGASIFRQPIQLWNTSSANSLSQMFDGATKMISTYNAPETPTVGFFNGVTFIGSGVGDTFTKAIWDAAGKPSVIKIIDYEMIDSYIWNGSVASADATIIIQVIFGSGVTTIVGTYSLYTIFWATDNLFSVTIGPHMTTIPSGFLGYGEKFTDIILDPANTTFHVQDNVLYKKNGSNNVHTMVQYPVGRDTQSFVVPNGVINISPGFAIGAVNMTDLTIPLGVTTIGSYAFHAGFITTINIPSSVTSIGNYAFKSTLVEMTSGASITVILPMTGMNGLGITSPSNGPVVFYNAPNVTIIPPSVTYTNSNGITTATFSNYGDFSSGALTGGTARLASTAPGNYTGIAATKVVVSSGITSIGDNAFANAPGLTEVTLPNTLTSIGNNAFSWNISGYSSLASVTILEGVLTIGDNAFRSTAITTITIPTSVTTINDHAFRDCNALSTVIFSNNSACTRIGESAFYDTILTTIYIPSSMTAIGSYAFKSTNLATISLPSSSSGTVPTIGNEAFSSLSPTNTIVEVRGTFTNDELDTWKGVHVTGVTKFSNAGQVVYNVETFAFTYVTHSVDKIKITGSNYGSSLGVDPNLNSPFGRRTIVIPSTINGMDVTHITGDTINAFKNTSITSVTIPETVTTIETSAFEGCGSLATLAFNGTSQCATIGDNAFKQTALTTVTVPVSVTTINTGAFEGCSSLTTLSFNGTSQCATIGASAFKSSSLTAVSIPSSVTTIGNSAFNSTSLETILLYLTASTNNDTSIGADAFTSMTSNNTIVEVIGVHTDAQLDTWKAYHVTGVNGTIKFSNAGQITYNLETFVFTYEVIDIYDGGLHPIDTNIKITGSNYGSDLLGHCDIPSTISHNGANRDVTHIKDDAFAATNITSLEVPISVVEIGEGAFSGTLLTVIDIHSSMILKDEAFYSTRSSNVVVTVDGLSNALELNAWKTSYSSKFGFDTSGNIAFVTGTNGIMTETYNNVNYVFKVIDPSISTVNVQIGNGTNVPGNGTTTTTAITTLNPPTTFTGGMFTVTRISYYAFHGRTNITSVIIPTTVTLIGWRSFEQCTSLTTLTFSSTSQCSKIGADAFKGSAITSVVIPASMVTGDGIGHSAFHSTPLESITIPSNVDIDANAFVGMTGSYNPIVTVTGVSTIPELNTWKNYDNNVNKFSLTSSWLVVIFVTGTNALMTQTVDGVTYVFTIISAGSNNVRIGDGSTVPGNGILNSETILPSFVIPTSFSGGFPVKQIGSHAFSGITTFTTVTIPPNTQTIGANAFYGTALTEVSIPDAISNIGASAFANTTALQTIIVPQNNVTYGSYAFATNSQNMISVTVRDISAASVLASWKTANNSYFTTESISAAPVAFLAGVGGFMTETIGNITYVFSFNTDGNDTVTNVRIGDGTTSAYNGTTTPLEIPVTFSPPTSFTGGFGVTEIGTNAFQGALITNLTIPDNVTAIGANAFTSIGDTTPPKVTVPSNIATTAQLVAYTDSNSSSFSGANSMSVVFSTSSGIMIETGSDYVFTVIDSATVPQKVRIGTGGGAASLSGNGMRNSPSSTETLETPNTFRGGFYSVTEIGQKAFQGYTIPGLIIHHEMENIKAHAFKSVQNIATINISHTTTIAAYAFNLMNIGTNTVTVTVEDLLSENEYDTWTTYNAGVTGRFSVVSGGTIVYNPGVKLTYEIINNAPAQNTVTIIGSTGNEFLTGTRVIRDTIEGLPVTAIRYNAFTGSHLTSISFPATLTSIGNGAFFEVDELTTVIYRDGPSIVTSIGEYAFAHTSLTSVTIPITMASIGYKAFSEITTLVNLQFTSGRSSSDTISIGEYAFKGTAMTAVNFPDTTTSIGGNAFMGGINLRHINIHGDTSVNTTPGALSFSGMSDTSLVIVRGLSANDIADSQSSLTTWKTSHAAAFTPQTEAGHIQFVMDDGHIVSRKVDSITYIITIIGDGEDKTARIGISTEAPANGVVFPIPSSVSNISIPSSIQITIGSVSDSYTVAKIGKYAFSHTELTGVTIPDSVTHIGNYAFYDTSLTSLVMETTTSALTHIGHYAFRNAIQNLAEPLVSIIIPNTVIDVGQGAFRDNIALKQISLNSSTNLGANAFRCIASKPRVLVFNIPVPFQIHTWRVSNEMKFSACDWTEVRFIPFYGDTLMSNVCFPAGTPLDTDQGIVNIDQLNIDTHTFRGESIVAVTQTVTEDECLIRFDVGSLSPGTPSIPTEMSCAHSILYKNKMIPAVNMVSLEGVDKIPYSPGTILFNVLLDTHSKMMVNKITAETLHPDNGVAKFTRALLATPDEGDRAEMIYNYNSRAKELGVFTKRKHLL